MSGASVRPGPQSIAALRWLTRMSASPGEPLALVMGWSERALYDHLARLIRAGLVRRVAMTRGEGSLIVVTADGAAMGGASRVVAPRSIAPATWAHVAACAWASAWFDVRGREWLSSREIAQEDSWRGQVVYEDGSGRTQRQRHRPDLGTYIGQTRRRVAVEVELQRKSPARLRGILAMYAARSDDDNAELAGVVYIAGANIAKFVRAAGVAVGLNEYPDGQLRVLELGDVIAQTRTMARKRRAAVDASHAPPPPAGA